VQIYAHQGEIAIVRLNSSGSKLATASDKGTLIRVWDTSTKQRLIEFRRGADPAQIYSIGTKKLFL
jgi:WD40 repeat protein